MRSLNSSLALVMFLALSNLSYGQFNSKEYLLSIGDLVNKKVLSEPYAINPLQKLYYVHLLPPNYLWRDLATMINLRGTTDEGAWSFVDDLSNIVDKMRWSDAELIKVPVKEPVREFITVPRNEPVRMEPSAYMTPVVIKEPAEEVKPLEKKTVVPVTKASKTTAPRASTAAEIEAEDEIVPAYLEGIISEDYIEYGSIGFYANAAIIHPSYKAEMASLAGHLKADKTLEVIIHGHCNGNSPRTIITPGLLTRFFEIDGFHQQQNASAKELTEQRAEYARRYLISQGIAEERIQAVGEGADMMIYPPTSDQAHYNDRVEFELIKPNKDQLEVGLVTPKVD